MSFSAADAQAGNDRSRPRPQRRLTYLYRWVSVILLIASVWLGFWALILGQPRTLALAVTLTLVTTATTYFLDGRTQRRRSAVRFSRRGRTGRHHEDEADGRHQAESPGPEHPGRPDRE